APAEPRRRNAMCVMAVLTAASGAWLVHAAGRLENRGTLMAFTVLHQAAAAMWAGGLLHLGAMWRLGRRDAPVPTQWPLVLSRFWRWALFSVAALSVAALPLAWTYVGSWGGLVGTGYGSLVLTKVGLLGAALVLAATNWTAVRRFRLRGRLAALSSR